MQNSLEILHSYFGHTDFRQGQQQIIDCLTQGRDAMGIMPTGSGKSLCYQIPALMLPGITLVISPLISLMKDQVNALTQQGVKAAFLNSSLNPMQYARALDNARAGVYKIIYVAPERLAGQDFQGFARQADISMVAVDEAHCVSQWGQDFRPSYLRVSEFISQLPSRPVVGAFTATATDRVQDDIVKLLELDEPYRLVTGFDRQNLHFSVVHTRNKMDELMEFLKGKEEYSGIIYCSTRKHVEQVCYDLQRQGLPATRYHAGLGEAERHGNQDDFIYDRKPIMVATNAFGMGIDKSDVRYVVHFNMPGNLENYYQEAGRAGRDGEPAHCLLMYQPKDSQTQQFFIDRGAQENEELSEEQRAALRKNDYELLRVMENYCKTSACLREYILGYFGEEMSEPCENCGNCSAEYTERDITVEAQKIISCVIRIESRSFSFGKKMVADVLKGSNNARLKGFGLDKLPTYGIMADMKAKDITALIDHLVIEGYLAVNDDKFGVLETTPRSRGVVSGDVQLVMKVKEQAAAPSGKSASRKADYPDIDMRLFDALRGLRKEIADEKNLPAYIVFSDAALRDMCAKQPRDAQEFMDVSGVGKQKCELYADAFTEIIREYLATGQA